jgi:hypothetical protein
MNPLLRIQERLEFLPRRLYFAVPGNMFLCGGFLEYSSVVRMLAGAEGHAAAPEMTFTTNEKAADGHAIDGRWALE